MELICQARRRRAGGLSEALHGRAARTTLYEQHTQEKVKQLSEAEIRQKNFQACTTCFAVGACIRGINNTYNRRIVECNARLPVPHVP